MTKAENSKARKAPDAIGWIVRIGAGYVPSLPTGVHQALGKRATIGMIIGTLAAEVCDGHR